MKKTYIPPTLRCVRLRTISMMASSLTYGTTSVSTVDDGTEELGARSEFPWE